ncbi:BREX-1 system adenine-specific DNA-methyltransferase PglX, partial [Acinetobacter lwoffii]
RDLYFTKPNGQLGFMSPMVWMFISSYENLRTYFIDQAIIYSLIQLEYNASGEVRVPLCAFILSKQHIANFIGSYIRLTEFPGYDVQPVKTLEALKNPKCGWFYTAKPDDFKKIPGSPLAYWVSEKVREIFEKSPSLGEVADARQGLATADNNRFLRLWQEVNIQRISFGMENREQAQFSAKKWFPYNKGGEFRKWYGNQEYLINWENDGKELFDFIPKSVIRNPSYYFKPSVGWSKITSSLFSMRYFPTGFIFADAGMSVFAEDSTIKKVMGCLNSKVSETLLSNMSPTLNFEAGTISKFPLIEDINNYQEVIDRLITQSKTDWDSYETSWDFTENPIIRTGQPNLEQAFNTWQQQNADAVAEMKRLEEENNKLFIDAYGLQDELMPDVPDEQITLTRADREKDSQRLVSYALGCMMGRYSLDEPGLIYAHAGNQDFDASRYQTFPADADGIIPLTEMHWFEDDATRRIQEFLTAVWGKDTLDTNMQWLAESLDKKANETAEDTIRRYLASKFYKDHMQTYKKRPIYWLFSSGKQGAFQALVYLHRYNESTLARMRTEYVMPLISKMAAMVNSLQSEIENSDSAAEIKRKEKELQNLHKQQAELSSFEEKLRHYADQRISLDLDDGVKVNYGKFGDLLAEVKAVTGEK